MIHLLRYRYKRNYRPLRKKYTNKVCINLLSEVDLLVTLQRGNLDLILQIVL